MDLALCLFDSEHAGERGTSIVAPTMSVRTPKSAGTYVVGVTVLVVDLRRSCRHGQPRPTNARKLGVRAPTTVSNVLCSILRLRT